MSKSLALKAFYEEDQKDKVSIIAETRPFSHLDQDGEHDHKESPKLIQPVQEGKSN
jgi:hypothetical protein